jgi:hypothetical protein
MQHDFWCYPMRPMKKNFFIKGGPLQTSKKFPKIKIFFIKGGPLQTSKKMFPKIKNFYAIRIRIAPNFSTLKRKKN